jgi:hypothetical protein
VSDPIWDELEPQEIPEGTVIPECVADGFEPSSNPANMAFSVGRMEEAVDSALYFAGRLRSSNPKQAIEDRLNFLKSELNLWYRKILLGLTPAIVQKEG